MNSTREPSRKLLPEYPVPEPAAVPAQSSESMDLAARVRAVIEMRGGLTRGMVRVYEHDGAIVLDGEVQKYYDRQVALTCTQHVPGVRHIIDRIRIREKRSGTAEET